MVKTKNKNIANKQENQGKEEELYGASKIGASTKYGYINERLSPFGGLLGLVKFLDLVNFKEIFNIFYKAPSRNPKLGHYNMVYGFIILLFIGFDRVWHFFYIQLDSIICGIFRVDKLPYVTTYWRYINSLGINQGKSFLNVISALRERVWHLCNISYEKIHIDIDTTVETVHGKQQGRRKGHNTKNRGKEGFRPIICFIEETREYFYGKLRSGKTISGEELAEIIKEFKKYIPGCVREVVLRGDSEFMNRKSVNAAIEEGYHFIFANKQCEPSFESSGWYKIRRVDDVEYNECIYKPLHWSKPCRFVAMRIPKEEIVGNGFVQLMIAEEMRYTYRIFVTNLTTKAHKVIAEYDKRADSENLIKEAKQEGLTAIPSKKFAKNYAYFQIVMLSYNIWRSFKLLAAYSASECKAEATVLKQIKDNTIRVGRLKLLLIAAKIAKSSNATKIKYSIHDSRVEGIFKFYKYLDIVRNKVKPWLDSERWECKHMLNLSKDKAAFSS